MKRLKRYLLPASMALVLFVQATNAAPPTVSFSSTPAPNGSTPTAVVGLQYLYRAVAAASDGSVVRYGLRYGPSGMSVDAESGRVTWVPGAAGTFPVGIRAALASDPAIVADQEWSLKVLPYAAPSVSVDGVSGTVFCVGDSITVTYSVGGSFNPGNAFIVQLSNAKGSFDSAFRNMASVSSTLSGTLGFRIPTDLPSGNLYRVRVIGSSPVTMGADNGTDLRIYGYPNPGCRADLNFNDSIDGHRSWLYLAHKPIMFHNTSSGSSSVSWDFGPDATPTTSTSIDSVAVTFSTHGTKEVKMTATSPGGCSQTLTGYKLMVVDPTLTTIPADVLIVQTDAKGSGLPGQRVWVCPGGAFHSTGTEFVYAETGSTVYLGSGADSRNPGAVFLKNGSSLIAGNAAGEFVVYEAGAGLNIVGGAGGVYKVASLVFDYTNAPAGGCPSLAPYTKRIPASSRRVVGKESSGESDREFWVRGAGELACSGSRDVFAVESGGKLTLTGNNCVVYLRSGASLDAHGSSGHRIFYETGATIVSPGDNSAMFPSNDITFLYQDAAVPTSGGDAVAAGITLAPNPASTDVRITSIGSPILKVIVVDAPGRTVCEQEVGSDHVDLSVAGLARGAYFVKVVTRAGTAVKQLLVR